METPICLIPWTSTSPKASYSRGFMCKRPQTTGLGTRSAAFGGASDVESHIMGLTADPLFRRSCKVPGALGSGEKGEPATSRVDAVVP